MCLNEYIWVNLQTPGSSHISSSGFFHESGPGQNTSEPQLSTGETWEIPEYVAVIK